MWLLKLCEKHGKIYHNMSIRAVVFPIDAIDGKYATSASGWNEKIREIFQKKISFQHL